MEPNVDDFDFLAGSGFVGGFFLGSRVEVDSGLLVFAPPLEAVAVAPPNKMLAMPEGNPLKPDEGSLDFCGFLSLFCTWVGFESLVTWSLPTDKNS